MLPVVGSRTEHFIRFAVGTLSQEFVLLTHFDSTIPSRCLHPLLHLPLILLVVVDFSQFGQEELDLVLQVVFEELDKTEFIEVDRLCRVVIILRLRVD